MDFRHKTSSIMLMEMTSTSSNIPTSPNIEVEPPTASKSKKKTRTAELMPNGPIVMERDRRSLKRNRNIYAGSLTEIRWSLWWRADWCTAVCVCVAPLPSIFQIDSKNQAMHMIWWWMKGEREREREKETKKTWTVESSSKSECSFFFRKNLSQKLDTTMMISRPPTIVSNNQPLYLPQ